jgi:hypothetical protein
MKNRIMITGVKPADYLTGFFRDNEAVLTAEERAAALVKGWDIAGVEGGSDEIYHYRIPANLAPDDVGKWTFKAVEIDCTGASGRTWGNGQKGPMDADVTFNAVEIKPIDLAALSADAERRVQQAHTQSEAFKQQRAALTALEAKVKERLAKAQAGETGKASK